VCDATCPVMSAPVSLMSARGRLVYTDIIKMLTVIQYSHIIFHII
jgi:hypothetical protein